MWHRQGSGKHPMSGMCAVGVALVVCAAWSSSLAVAHKEPTPDAPGGAFQVGFAEVDITPQIGTKPVYLAGFGQNRRATAVHDPLFVRAVVFRHGRNKLAWVCADLIGLFYRQTLHVRAQLPDFAYVLVSATHNHDGPDTLGLWGPNPLTSGVDREYLQRVEKALVQAVRDADSRCQPAQAFIGQVPAPELLKDSREPYVLHEDLVVLSFRSPEGKLLGLVVQWNCHPETMGSRNTEVSADYVGFTVAALARRHACPVAYFTGTVGGLLSSLGVRITDDAGRELADGTFEKTERYGLLLARRCEDALARSQPLRATPFVVRRSDVFVPIVNKLYLAARRIGVLDREAYIWRGDPYGADPTPVAAAEANGRTLCIRTEVALLQLGDLGVAVVPGEIYPELVLGKVQDPADPGADFPDAPIEPAVYAALATRHKMLIGLGNDEIGYIIPKRQWDEKPPYCYGRRKAQYGEINSVGPDAAPIVCGALHKLAR